MSTPFTNEERSVSEGQAPTAEDDSRIYSRNVSLKVSRPRAPRLRQGRPNPNTPSCGKHRWAAASIPATDSQTAARCLEAIHWITTLPVDQVKVTVASGWVTLEGTVDHEVQREIAAEAIRKLEGVAGVDNQILVR